VGKRHTILVVDDEPDIVQSVKDLLRLDYKVLGATRVADGVKLMQEHPVDVVMTDQRMPDMTGVQFLSDIKEPYPDATRLLFTGYADIRAVIDAINQGNVYRYITKPWDPDELQTVIREACERHDLIVQRRELVDQLQHSNKELEEANARLSQADRLKTAFIQVASHELRTPLTILNGYAQLAAKSPSLEQPLRGWIEHIHQSGKRLTGIVNQIVAMLEQGDFRSNLQCHDIDVAGLASTAADDVQPFVELRKQTLSRDWNGDLGTITADRTKLRDCLNQLLLNAIKFTPDGGSIAFHAGRAADGGAEFVVSDTGCGMDCDSLEQFGKAFFTQFDVTHHASGTHEHDRRGLGLGVTLVRRFAEMHGGWLTACSHPGGGTAVRLYVPAAPPHVPSH
jgi:signal transduction histidine kinase